MAYQRTIWRGQCYGGRGGRGAGSFIDGRYEASFLLRPVTHAVAGVGGRLIRQPHARGPRVLSLSSVIPLQARRQQRSAAFLPADSRVPVVNTTRFGGGTRRAWRSVAVSQPPGRRWGGMRPLVPTAREPLRALKMQLFGAPRSSATPPGCSAEHASDTRSEGVEVYYYKFLVLHLVPYADVRPKQQTPPFPNNCGTKVPSKLIPPQSGSHLQPQQSSPPPAPRNTSHMQAAVQRLAGSKRT